MKLFGKIPQGILESRNCLFRRKSVTTVGSATYALLKIIHFGPCRVEKDIFAFHV